MQDGWSVLCLALKLGVTLGNVVIARLLLVAGTTVDVGMGEDGATVLIVAAANNWLDFARLLFEFRANSNVVAKDGGTALHCAALLGHAAMARLLVDHGAALNVQAVDGETALLSLSASLLSFAKLTEP